MSERKQGTMAWCAVLVMALVMAPAAMAGSRHEVFVDDELLYQIQKNPETGYLIYFRDKADLSPAFEMNWEERGRFVYRELTSIAENSQRNVREYLTTVGADFKPFWIDNLIVLTRGDFQIFNGLLSFSEIESLRALPEVGLIEPEDGGPVVAPMAVEPNITWVNAPDVWALGYTGSGIVVANIDTGVRYTHQALANQYRGNLGGGSFDHNFNWWDPYLGVSAPSDFHNHGSHTMGTMVGDDGSANQIGMAPGAQWIACKTFEGGDITAQLLECGQFMAAPWDLNGQNADPDRRPHVVNNSWGSTASGYFDWYKGTVAAWRAAGIMPVFSIGNNGPGCGTYGSPGGYTNVMGVGGTTQSGGGWYTSSAYGPTAEPPSAQGYEDLMGFPSVKPNVVAPGSGIRSAYRTGDTAYGSMSGTSMSAPHVAGLVALMWEACPAFIGDYVTTATILMEEADRRPFNSACGGEGPAPDYLPNNRGGWGEIDSLAAVNAILNLCGPTGVLEGTVTSSLSGDPIAGATVQAVAVGPLAQPNSTYTTTTDASGFYQFPYVAEGAYDVTASAFGYGAETAYDVLVDEDLTTVQDFVLDPEGTYIVDGFVTADLHQFPLWARIDISMGGTVVHTAYTSPWNGYYEVDLPNGATYDFVVTSLYPGWNPAGRSVTVASAHQTQNFYLTGGSGNEAYECRLVGGLDEDFEGVWPPQGWTVENLGGNCVWQLGTSGNLTGGTGQFAVANSDACGSGTTMNTTLTSPVLDLTGVTAPWLQFKYDYYHLGSQRGHVEISTNGGASWTVIHEFNASDRGPKTLALDVSATLGNQANARIRFRYVATGWQWWWQVDDVRFIEAPPPEDVVIPPTGYQCTAVAGALLAGYVFDENTDPLAGIVGATVSRDLGGSATTMPAIANVGAGFYHMFSPNPSHQPSGPSRRTFTASATGYGSVAQEILMVPGTVNRLDFTLPSGWLEVTPNLLWGWVHAGNTEDLPLHLINHGGLPVNYQLLVAPVSTTWSYLSGARDVSDTPNSGEPPSLGLKPFTSEQPATPHGSVPFLTPVPAYGMKMPATRSLVHWSDVTTPGVWTEVAPVAGAPWTGDFLLGDFSKLYVLENDNKQLRTIDTTTGAVTVIGPSNPQAGHTWTGMTASAGGTVYASSTDINVSTLYSIDPGTGAATVIGSITNAPAIIDIAISPAGEMFGVEIVNNNLVQIDPATGAGTVVGPLGFDANFGQGLDFDDTTGTLYWLSCGTPCGELRVIDITTGASSAVGAVPANAQVGAFAIATYAGSSLPWLELNPTEGDVPVYSQEDVNAHFIADGAGHFGIHRARVTVVHDSAHAVDPVDVCMTRAFYDVTKGHWSDVHVHALAGARVVGWYEEFGYFRPNLDMNRGAMARWLLRGKYGPNYQPDPCEGIFADVSCELTPNADYIEQLYRDGITGGCATNPLRYCPEDPVRRHHMAVFLLRTLEGSTYTPPACTGIFDDVPCPSTYAGWVEDLYNRGITGGCSTTPLLYCPTNFSTRAQMSVFTNRTFGIPTTCQP